MFRIFGEKDFKNKMETVVAPFIRENVKDGYFYSSDGARMHYYAAVNQMERAAVVISHGFKEFFSKYHEMTYYLYKMGYSVFFIDHRGHGFSYREVPEYDKVTIKSYNRYVEDLKSFMDQIVSHESMTRRYYLIAHSMGGAIGALFLEKYPKYFKKAVLSAPLMEMNFQGIPKPVVRFLLIFGQLMHWNTRYVPKQHGYTGKYNFKTSNCMSQPRYEYIYQYKKTVPQFQMSGGSYDWTNATVKATRQILRDVEKVRVPVLLIQAGADSVVKLSGQNRFADRSLMVHMVRIPDSKHEMFNGTLKIRKKFYSEVFKFLG